MDENKKRDIKAYLILILVLSAFFFLAMFIDRKLEPSHHSEDYDEYLEEVYDGLERYDPV